MCYENVTVNIITRAYSYWGVSCLNHDADAETEERFWEVDDLFTICSDSQWSDGKVSFLCTQTRTYTHVQYDDYWLLHSRQHHGCSHLDNSSIEMNITVQRWRGHGHTSKTSNSIMYEMNFTQANKRSWGWRQEYCVLSVSLYISNFGGRWDGWPCPGSIPGAGHLFRYVTNQPSKVNSAFHPSGVGKWVPASAGKAKACSAYGSFC